MASFFFFANSIHEREFLDMNMFLCSICPRSVTSVDVPMLVKLEQFLDAM